MSAPQQRNLHFVNLSYPTTVDARSARRQARSHSARETHARSRRLQIAKYLPRNAAQHAWRSEVDCQDDAAETPFEGHPLAWSSNAGHRGRASADMLSSLSNLALDRRDPFACCAMPLKPIDHFLLYHYVTVVLPSMETHCVMFQAIMSCSYIMPLDWVKLSLTDRGLLCGILLASCRYLCVAQHQEHKFTQLAIEYKLASMRQLSATIREGASPFKDSTVANVLALALDEIALGDVEVSRNHVLGAAKIVELNGGPQTLGLNGFLGFLLDKFLYDEGLFDNQPSSSDTLLDIPDV